MYYEPLKGGFWKVTNNNPLYPRFLRGTFRKTLTNHAPTKCRN